MDNKDWTKLVERWVKKLKENKFDPGGLFVELKIGNQEYPDRSRQLAWVPTKDIHDVHCQQQRDVLERPDVNGTVVWYQNNSYKGELHTLYLLWKVRDSVEATCAVLILASLESRKHVYAPDFWRQIDADTKRTLESFLYFEYFRKGNLTLWHSNSRQLLPDLNEDPPSSPIFNQSTLVDYLADTHVEVLKNVRPIYTSYSKDGDPEILAAVSKEIQHEKMLAEQRDIQYQEMLRQRELEENRRTELHPRWREWGSISREELQTLVWSEPTSHVAKLFGVSDVSVANACKKWEIERPPRGYWARVKAGKIPHPQGTPEIFHKGHRR